VEFINPPWPSAHFLRENLCFLRVWLHIFRRATRENTRTSILLPSVRPSLSLYGCISGLSSKLWTKL